MRSSFSRADIRAGQTFTLPCGTAARQEEVKGFGLEILSRPKGAYGGRDIYVFDNKGVETLQETTAMLEMRAAIMQGKDEPMKGKRRLMLGVLVAALAAGASTALASSRLPDVGGGTVTTGLANAIAHVQANEAAHPNSGLANALTHLQANQAKHTTKGLANAIAHVQANEAAHPNSGLANALTHLQANQAKHQSH
jgi:hypothetical protein